MKNIFLGIGTNIGDREANLNAAVGRIEEKLGHVIKSSSVYETEPWGFNSENKFLNIVVEVETTLLPSELLDSIHSIEALLGRLRGEVQYSSRVIDIDIIFYEDQFIIEKDLIIPHPLMQERKFVLVPLCEIASELVHPVLKKPVADLLKSCRDVNVVKKYKL